MRRFLLFLLLAAVLPLGACAGKSDMSGMPAASGSDPVSLEGRQWQAVSLYGKAIEHFADQDVPHLVFFEVTPTSARVAGSDGCNRLIGSATFNGDAITFPPMGATMMACPFGYAQSTAFKKALAETTARRMVDGKLELLAGETVLLVLTPVAEN